MSRRPGTPNPQRRGLCTSQTQAIAPGTSVFARVCVVGMPRIALIVLAVAVFVAGFVGAYEIIDQHGTTSNPALALMVLVSLLLGLATGRPWAVWLSLSAVLISLPYGTVENQIGTEPNNITWGSPFFALLSALFIAAGVWLRPRVGRGRLRAS